jgi:precorrin-6Y C5,15-methyltransferase (decarboxylating)
MYDIYVIGIGYKPLDSQERKILFKSDIILSSERLLKVFKKYREFKKVQERVVILNTVDLTVEFIRSRIDRKKRESPVTVLASGDPLFFGIGRRIVSEFGKERVEIMPDLSCIQVAMGQCTSHESSQGAGPSKKKKSKV